MRILILCALLAVLAAPAGGVEAELRATLTLRDADPAFGGMSGLIVAPDGGSLTAVGDRGIVLTARIEREGGEIAGLAGRRVSPLRDLGGAPLAGELVDAEGIAVLPGGGFAVSFEGVARVWSYAGPDAVPTAIPDAPAFAGLQFNSGLEALASDAGGRLYAIPERSGEWARPFPVYRLDGAGWDDTLHIPRSERFLITGADFGPDGRLYILERDFVWPRFASRIRRVTIADHAAGAVETLWQSEPGTQGNLEGIAAWRDPAGAIRLLLIADDNFNLFQTTTLLELRVVE